MLLYALTIFLSAFLLFQVQPIIAKIILPWFGGSSAVWTTCMLFFQSVLFLGYVYAHWLNHRLAGRKQAMLHTLLLSISLAALPILPNSRWKSVAVGNPSWRILALLSLTIGAPYFLLSSTSPLLQAWYARNHDQAMPYRLFALSNLASMLALLSYPVGRAEPDGERASGNLVHRLRIFRHTVRHRRLAGRRRRRGAGSRRTLRATRYSSRVDGSPALDRLRRVRFDSAAGGDHLSDARRGRDSVSMDCAPQRVPAEFHPLL